MDRALVCLLDHTLRESDDDLTSWRRYDVGCLGPEHVDGEADLHPREARLQSPLGRARGANLPRCDVATLDRCAVLPQRDQHVLLPAPLRAAPRQHAHARLRQSSRGRCALRSRNRQTATALN